MDDYTPQTICLLAVLFITLLLLSRRKWLQSPALRTPPSPPALPIIGHLHLLTDPPHHSLADLALKLGPIIQLRLGQVATVVVSSARLADLVLKTHDHIFANRPPLTAAQHLSFGCTDVTFSHGPYWRQARKICVTELFSPKRVTSFQLIRNEETHHLITSLSALSGSETDLSQLFFTLANNVLCRVAFGKRFMDDSEGEKKHIVDVLTETQALFGGFCIGDFFPDWKWLNTITGFNRRLRKNLEDLIAVYNEIIEEHVNEEKEREDFVGVLLRVQKRKDLEVAITDDNMKAIVLDMFVAGTDSTASALEWTMAELARKPHMMRKAQQEVRNIASGEGKVEESHLPQLHYMKAAIKETMRLHPPVPLLVPRQSMENCILDGYEIPAKTRLLVNAYAIGRDPQSWENPLDFNPERFVDGDVDVRGQDTRFIPFGGGRRGCPGYSFGLATVEIALARLLYHFDWELPHGVEADDIDLSEIFGLTTRKKSALILVPRYNRDHEIKENDM
ncbi:hypothetical protein PVL29_001245 [Vitis rotundifolia]|uniref:Uncharacterized protein n=1 Tax=Vitis rotundifolia TaxID=103349 RepID=A0AA39E625_VITRO|nr:hypothetical protein PVL29_001245 [Vitis rotundifolia]